MSWSFLTSLLGEISNHSTFIGKVWLAVLIVLRIVVIAVVGDPIYNDEQREFQCDTLSVGCEDGCYSAFLPISPIRFWAMQVIVITTPTLMYVIYAMHKIVHMENQCKHDGRRHIKDDGLMKVYVVQLLVRGTLEAVFLYVQYMMYGLEVVRRYDCTTIPECVDSRRYPDTLVDVTRCYVTRHYEKTSFLYTMYGVSGLCLLFTILEIIYLGFSALRDCCCTTRHTAALSVRRPPSPQCYLHTAIEIEDEERAGPFHSSSRSPTASVHQERLDFVQEK